MYGRRRVPKIASVITLALALVVPVAVMSGCGSITLQPAPSTTTTTASATTPTPATPAPPTTVTPRSLDWSDAPTGSGGQTAADVTAATLTDAYSVACENQGVSKSAAYAGGSHPLVMVDSGSDEDAQDWESQMADTPELRPRFVNDVQLVACITTKQVPASSCGTYERSTPSTGGSVSASCGVPTATPQCESSLPGLEERSDRRRSWLRLPCVPCRSRRSELASRTEPHPG